MARLSLAFGFAIFALPGAALADCPSYANPGAALTYTAESAFSAHSSPVVAGGDTDLGTCDAALTVKTF